MRLEQIKALLDGELPTTVPLKALAIAQERQATALNEGLATVLVDVLKKAGSSINGYASTIREYRAEIDRQRKALKAMARAQAFAESSGNVWPLVRLTGHERQLTYAFQAAGIEAPAFDDPGWVVPDSFVETAAAGEE